MTKSISRKVCHVGLHKAYFLGQAWNQNSFKEDKTLKTCCQEKKRRSPKALSHTRYSHKHLLPSQLFLLLKTKESVPRSLEQLSLSSQTHSNMTHTVGLWMGCCSHQNRQLLSLILGAIVRQSHGSLLPGFPQSVSSPELDTEKCMCGGLISSSLINSKWEMQIQLKSTV